MYIIQDTTTPVVSISFTTKAGYSLQTKTTTGFPELYSRLFFQCTKQGLSSYSTLGATNLIAECTADSAIYTLSCPISSLSSILEVLAESIINPSLSDSEIVAAYNKVKEETVLRGKLPTTFIESSMDSILFSNAPWKIDSGVYPSLFSKSSIETIRNNLGKIAEKAYVPNNSALFISGPVIQEEILLTVKNIFGNWKPGVFQSSNIPDSEMLWKDDIKKQDSQKKDSKKYVITSDNFSKDYNQIILQYKTPGLYSDITSNVAAQIAASVLENEFSFKNAVTTNKDTGINNSMYVNAGFTQKGMGSYITIQGLVPVSKVSPVSQIESFKNTVLLSNTTEIENQRKTLVDQTTAARKDSPTLLSSIATTWAYGNTEYFYEFGNLLESISEAQIVATTTEEPYEFIVVHTATYNANKKSFDKEGFIQLTEKNGPWYTTDSEIQNFMKKGQTENGQTDNEQTTTKNVELSLLTDFATENKQQYSFHTLSNGIPVITKDTSFGSGITIRISFTGGEHKETLETRGFETVIIKALAENIQKQCTRLGLAVMPDITTETSLYKSSINVTCLYNQIDLVLDAMYKALVFDQVSPSQIDGIIYMENYNWRIKSATTDFQLYSVAMETLFSGTGIEKLFSTDSNILSSVNFSDVNSRYTSLLDANRISFYIAGNKASELIDSVEKDFGILRELPVTNQNKEIEEATPFFTNTTRYVRLKRIFTTDIAAEDAGPRPTVLIPTEKFDDPVQYYFKAPLYNTQEYPLYCSLMYELEEKLNNLWQNGVTVEISNPSNPIVQVSFFSVPQDTDVFPLFAKAFNTLQDSHSEIEVSQLKNRYTMKNMSSINNQTEVTRLAEKSFIYGGSPTYYLDQYTNVQNATWTDFYRSLDCLRKEFSILELRSSDTTAK